MEMHRPPSSSVVSRVAGVAIFAVLVAVLVVAPQPSRGDSTVILPSSQTLTYATQTAGTFAPCAEDSDAVLCEYTEGDDGAGATQTVFTYPNGASNNVGYAFVGCALATAYECVDDFSNGVGPNDGDTTYLSCPASSGAGCNIRFDFLGCNDAVPVGFFPLCNNPQQGNTYLHVTAWAWVRNVDGPFVDERLVLDTYSGGTYCSFTSNDVAITGSYANYSDHDDVTCEAGGWTQAEVDAIQLDPTTVCLGGAPNFCDAARVTAVGMTWSLRQPNYRATVQYDFTGGIASGGYSFLQVRAAVPSGESFTVEVFNWGASTWRTCPGTLTETTQTDYGCDLVENDEVSSTGAARVRFVDGNAASDLVQGTLAIDEASILTVSNPEIITGGTFGFDPLLLLCDVSELRHVDCITYLSRLVPGVAISRTDWFVDQEYIGNGTALTGRAHVFSFDRFKFPSGVVNVSVLVSFNNGQLMGRSRDVLIDNTWLLLLLFLVVVLVVVVLLYFVASKKNRRRTRRERLEKNRDARRERRSHRRRDRAVAATFALLFLLAAAPPSSAGDAAPPPTAPYLTVSSDVHQVETWDRFTVRVDSWRWGVNESGNLTLEPSFNAISVVITDTEENVVVKRHQTFLFNGSAEYGVYVEPLWTTTMLRVNVTDTVSGLSDSTYVRTRMSTEYLALLFEKEWIDAFVVFSHNTRAWADAEIAFRTGVTVGINVLVFLLLSAILLKREHRHARGIGLPSLWDRFTARYFPYSLVHDDTYIWLDPERTWDDYAARSFAKGRTRATLRRLRESRSELLEEINRIKTAGQVS